MKFGVTLALIEAFIAVAETRNFRQASLRLQITQPAVTHRIKLLEEKVGIQLFHRTSRAVDLTDAGRQFYEGTRDLVSDIDSVVDSLLERAEVDRGTISIVVLPSIAATVLPPLLKGFKERYPATEFKLYDSTPGRANDLLFSGEVDIAITSQKPVPGIEFIEMLTDPCVALASSDHSLAKRKTVTLTDVAAHPLLLYPPYTMVRRVLDEAFAELGLSVEPAYEAYNVATLISLAEAGFGIAFVPRLILSRFNLGRCVMLDLNERSLDRHFGIQKLKKRTSSIVRRFVNYCSEVDWKSLSTLR